MLVFPTWPWNHHDTLQFLECHVRSYAELLRYINAATRRRPGSVCSERTKPQHPQRGRVPACTLWQVKVVVPAVQLLRMLFVFSHYVTISKPRTCLHRLCALHRRREGKSPPQKQTFSFWALQISVSSQAQPATTATTFQVDLLENVSSIIFNDLQSQLPMGSGFGVPDTWISLPNSQWNLSKSEVHEMPYRCFSIILTSNLSHLQHCLFQLINCHCMYILYNSSIFIIFFHHSAVSTEVFGLWVRSVTLAERISFTTKKASEDRCQATLGFGWSSGSSSGLTLSPVLSNAVWQGHTFPLSLEIDAQTPPTQTSDTVENISLGPLPGGSYLPSTKASKSLWPAFWKQPSDDPAIFQTPYCVRFMLLFGSFRWGTVMTRSSKPIAKQTTAAALGKNLSTSRTTSNHNRKSSLERLNHLNRLKVVKSQHLFYWQPPWWVFIVRLLTLGPSNISDPSQSQRVETTW